MSNRVSKYTGIAVAMLLLWAVPSAAAADTLDALVAQLAGNDPVAQCNARVMLRQRHDARVAPKLAALLGNENEQVWRAAFNALADQANMVGVAGRETDRLVVTDAIMALMAPGTSDHVKRQAMRLLPLVVPEGYDVSPVAAQLDNPDLRERARKALQHIGTEASAKALRTYLPKADPAFQAAILHALDMMSRKSSIGTFAEYAADSHPPEVRVAAALALSRTGDPRWLPALRAVREGANDATLFDATDALLRLADNMAENGGNWSLAMQIYRDTLATEANSVVRGAALVGLGKYGDETVLPDIIAAIKADKKGDLFGPGLAALENLKGRAAGEALLKAYDQFPGDMQVRLLGIFGRKGDPAFLGPLNRQVHSPDPRFQEAAIAALVATGLPEAVSGMVDYALTTDGARRAQVAAAIERMANDFRARGQAGGAGSAFLGLYRLAKDDATRQRALAGIQQFPTPEAFAYIIDDIGTENLSTLSVPMLAGMTRALKDAGREEDSVRAFNALKGRLNSTEAVRAMLALAPSMDKGGHFLERLGFITKWRIVGPFPWNATKGFSVTNINEPNVDPAAVYNVGGGQVRWQAVDTAPGYTVDLADIYDMPTSCSAYGYTEIEMSQACDAAIRVGSDDGIKVWVNGEAVLEKNVDRGSDIDQDVASIKLNAGVNRILVECTQGGGGWNFLARLTTPEGFPLTFGLHGN